MIVDAILSVLLAPLNWVLEQIPTVTWPTWFSASGPGSVVEQVGEWGQHVGHLGYWYPVSEAFTAMEIVFVAGAAALVIKIVRLVVSYLTGGGGAT